MENVAFEFLFGFGYEYFFCLKLSWLLSGPGTLGFWTSLLLAALIRFF